MPHKQNNGARHQAREQSSLKAKSTAEDADQKKAKLEYVNTIKREGAGFQQDDNTVTVTLLLGKKIKTNDMDVVFTPNECNVVLTDGRRWHITFFREIDYVASKVQLKQMRLLLKVKKKVPGHWMDLEYIPGQSKGPGSQETEAELSDQKPHSSPKTTANQRSVNSPAEDSLRDSKYREELSDKNQPLPEGPMDVSNSGKNAAEKAERTSKCDSEPENESEQRLEGSKDKKKHQMNMTGRGVKDKPMPKCSQLDEGELAGKIETAGAKLEEESRKTAEDKLDLSDLLGDEPDRETEVKDEKSESNPDGVHVLNHLKTDFFEKMVAKPNDTITLTVFVKSVIKDSVNLHVDGKFLTLNFQTQDSKFLSMHEGTDENTTFLWSITVVDELIAAQCSFRVKSCTLDIILRKKVARRWCALEAVNSREYAQTSSTWKPVKSTAKVTPLPSCQSDVREKLSSQSKVGFTSTSSAGAGQKKAAVEHSENESAGGVKTDNKGSVLGESNKDNIQKPTCMVSPLKPNAEKSVVAPGYTGLDNMGNTCFMNSVLQVLSNTRELRDYFLDGRFQKEINMDNPLGSGGNLAVEFATLLKTLWSGKRHSFAPSNLKKLVAQKKSMFSGFAQHDAQEYMSFLLDGLHEDLNRVKKKPYIEQVDSGGRPDEVVAEEFWTNHRKRDNSFLVDLFQGQYKSKLVCPVCAKVSVTFDPFMHLPVPLPKKQKHLPVVFMPKDPRRHPVRYMLKLANDATVENLKDAISAKTAVRPCHLRVFEAYKSRVHVFFTRGSSLSAVSEHDKIIVHEVLSEKLAGEPVKEIVMIQRTMRPLSVVSQCSYCGKEAKPDVKLKRCSACLRRGYCDSVCQKNDWPRHKPACRKTSDLVGMPFIISLPQSQLTFARIYEMADAYSRYSVDVFQPPQSAIPATSSVSSMDSQDDTAVFKTSTMFGDDDDDEAKPIGSSAVPSGSTGFLNEAGVPRKTTLSSSSSLPADLGNCDKLPASYTPVIGAAGATSDTPRGGADTSVSESITQETEVSDRKSSPDEAKGTPTRVVLGRQQDPERPAHLFQIRPCGKDGTNIVGSGYLQDGGDEALDLGDTGFLAVDWKNDDRSRPYVMVQTREFEVIDDESVSSGRREEKRDCNLQQCISLFMQPEVLSAEEAWYCPRCKEHREATKQLSLWRLPSYLIIQLKRFSYKNFLWCDKVDKMVKFPTRSLDMGSYFVGTMAAGQPAPVYDLTGVVNHYGSILGGHYTSFVRMPATDDPRRSDIGWRLCDDSRVSSCNEDRIVTPAAYVLFYRRRESIPIAPSMPKTVPLASGVVGENKATCDNSEKQDNETQGLAKSDTKKSAQSTNIIDSGKGESDSGVGFSDSGNLTKSQLSSSSAGVCESQSTGTGDSWANVSGVGRKLDFTTPQSFDSGESIDIRMDDDCHPQSYTDMDSVD